MKEDKLKKYIEDHRDEFDTDHPSSHVWSAIEKQINQRTHPALTGKTIAFRIMKIAAGVCLLLLAGAGGGMYLQQQKYGEAIHISTDEREEYMEAKSYFTSQIDSKISELQKYKNGEELLHELNQIDQVSAELKLEMIENPDQDKDLVIKQMIKQYQQKLNTLNKILDKLQETNQSKDNQSIKKNSTNDTIQL